MMPLKRGDRVRILAPSQSLATVSQEVLKLATQRLESIGLSVEFGANAFKNSSEGSATIPERLEDIHTAFSDSSVDAVLAGIGGYNSNQLLEHIDYDLIKHNPKIWCGCSDISAINNALIARASLPTFSSPNFISFGMLKGIEAQLRSFQIALFSDEEFTLLTPPEWSDDSWWRDQESRNFQHHDGFQSFQEGSAKGVALGGNLSTISLLFGTTFWSKQPDIILFVEDDNESDFRSFERQFQSLIHQEWFTSVKGIVLGRFQRSKQISYERLVSILHSKKQIPIIYDVDYREFFSWSFFSPSLTLHLRTRLRRTSPGSL